MAKYKRWEQPFVKSLDSDSQRAVRHSRKPLHGGRGVVCEECSDPLPPAHPFTVYGCWCVRCWMGLVGFSEEH